MHLKSLELIKRGFITIIGVILLTVIFLLVFFRNELYTLKSIEIIDDHPLYSMTFRGDYQFDEFLKIGAKSDMELEEFLRNRLVRGRKLNLNIPSVSCTSFTAINEYGEQIYGRNFDYRYAPTLLLKTNPSNGYASISMVNLAFAGYTKDNLPKRYSLGSIPVLSAPYLPFDGMNERGVAISVLAVPDAQPPKDTDKIYLNTTTAIRLVLDKASSVNEAMGLLEKYNYYFTSGIDVHYLLSDASGKTVIASFEDNEVKFYENYSNYQIASNFSFRDLNLNENNKECTRYFTAFNKLSKNNGVLTEYEAIKLLEDVIIDGKTQWSVLYNQITGKVIVFMNMNFDNPYIFNLDMLHRNKIEKK